MRPRNSPERRNAFVRFVLFYLITTLLIVGAVYFGLQVPFKENQQLQSQLENVHREREFDRKMYSLISETRRMLDSVNNAGINTEVVEGRITEKIIAMDGILRKDSTASKTIYLDLVSIFTDSKEDKKMLRAGSNKDEMVRLKDEEIQRLNQNLLQWKQAYEELKADFVQLQNRQ